MLGRSYLPAVDQDPWDKADRSAEPDDEPESPSPQGTGSGALTPGERLLYALGQLYRLSKRGELDVRPADFDVWDLAGIIGVRGDVEFISEDQSSSRWHFATEVLHVDVHRDFPWRLLSMWEWADEAESSS